MIPEWEYQVYDSGSWLGQVSAQEYLNQMGKDGWELVHISDSLRTYFFKRQKPLPEDISFSETQKQIVEHMKEINDKNKKGCRRT